LNLDPYFSDVLSRKNIKMERKMSKAKGRKEKEKAKAQIKGKKQVAAKHVEYASSKSQNYTGESRKSA
jgi:hypothetical protein